MQLRQISNLLLVSLKAILYKPKTKIIDGETGGITLHHRTMIQLDFINLVPTLRHLLWEGFDGGVHTVKPGYQQGILVFESLDQ